MLKILTVKWFHYFLLKIGPLVKTKSESHIFRKLYIQKVRTPSEKVELSKQ